MNKLVKSFLINNFKASPRFNISYIALSNTFSKCYTTGLVNIQKASFAKISKKKQEKIEHQKERSQTQLSQEIDLAPIDTEMKEVIVTFKNESSKFKVGRLTPQFFDDVKINAYGEKTPLSDLVQFVPKSATTIALSVFDQSLVNEIGKILENSDKNLQIKREGKVITCTMTAGNTKETKETFVKQLKVLFENMKNEIRRIRSEGTEKLNSYKKFVSEDDIKRAEKEIDEMRKKYTDELEKFFKQKSKDIMDLQQHF